LAEKKMTAASLHQGNRPRPSVHLSDETVRVRDALIDKFSDKSLEELNAFILMALETEQDEAKRLGVLAARVYILRMRINNVVAFNNDPIMTKMPTLTTQDLAGGRSVPIDAESSDTDDDFDPDQFEEWTELRIIEDGEINGVRFPKDAIITVGPFDAYRLLKTEKATYEIFPETKEENAATVGDLKNINQVEKELGMLSSDDDEIVAVANSDPQVSDTTGPASVEDAPLEEDGALGDDTQDDSAVIEEGIDPFANR
jgi:hypothetical protein